jgi:hypothetical protein
MQASGEGKAVHKISNTGAQPVVIVLEPWGGEYDIDPNQALELVVEGSLEARLEIEIEDNRLTVISDGPDLRITRDGKPVAAR